MTIPALESSRVRASRQSRPGLARIGQSYIADVRGWISKLAVGYGIAAALMLVGLLAVFGAIVVGFIALFHYMQLRYGTEIAFGALGGGFFALGVILLLIGWVMIGRRPPVPKPDRQFNAAKQLLVGSTVSRAVSTLYKEGGAKPDLTTQVLLGAAAVVAVGWLAAHNMGSRRRSPPVP